MPGEKIRLEEKQTGSQGTEKEAVDINKMEGRVCYFSLAGDLALNTFSDNKLSTFSKDKRRNRLKSEFTQRLYLAILMFDKVVMHCSDPLRSEIVLEVLEEHVQWIESGHIVFIFSNHIKNIRDDYKKYIEDKIKEYSEGYCSEKEAESLKQGHINTGYYERVIDLLEKTKYLIRKPDKDKYSFDRLVVDDLERQTQTENVIIDSFARLPQILSLNLSLYQLLHVRHLKCKEYEENEVGRFVFPQDIVDDVVEKIRECLEQGNIIARSAIVDSLVEKIKDKGSEITKLQKNVIKAITLRMDILYCKMNSGEQLILEFHPSYELRNNYQLDCFKEYLKIISAEEKEFLSSVKIINKILQDNALDIFRMVFLNCMSDTREHMNLAQININNSKQYTQALLELFHLVAVQNEKVMHLETMNSIINILKEAI